MTMREGNEDLFGFGRWRSLLKGQGLMVKDVIAHFNESLPFVADERKPSSRFLGKSGCHVHSGKILAQHFFEGTGLNWFWHQVLLCKPEARIVSDEAPLQAGTGAEWSFQRSRLPHGAFTTPPQRASLNKLCLTYTIEGGL